MEAVAVDISGSFLFEVMVLFDDRFTTSKDVGEEDDVPISYIFSQVGAVVVKSHPAMEIEQSKSLEQLGDCSHVIFVRPRSHYHWIFYSWVDQVGDD